MLPTRQGSFRLFRFAGIDVFLHWSWFLVAAFEISSRTREYSWPIWNALEYLTLFLIVLMHEFGHSLACRQVGGQANQIVLWPLGGVAYVTPPQRPGAMLWSIAAGPLVNLALVPVLSIFWLLTSASGGFQSPPDIRAFAQAIWFINFGLLIFNLLPIYPLDGGQILRSLLWFGLGRARSLKVAALVGLVGAVGLMVLAFKVFESVWIAILCAFILLNCWRGLMEARGLTRVANAPRHETLACPACKASPPRGPFWMCGKCRKPFDTFEAQAVCPNCGTGFGAATCPECGELSPIHAWNLPPPISSGPPPIPNQSPSLEQP